MWDVSTRHRDRALIGRGFKRGDGRGSKREQSLDHLGLVNHDEVL